MWPCRQAKQVAKLVAAVEPVLGAVAGRDPRSAITCPDLVARNSRLTTVSNRLTGDERHHLGGLNAAEVVGVVGQQAPGREAGFSTVLSPSERREDVDVGFSAANRLTAM